MPFSPAKLRAARESRGWSPEMMAAQTLAAGLPSVSNQTVRNLESARHKPNLATLETLAATLGLELVDLLE